MEHRDPGVSWGPRGLTAHKELKAQLNHMVPKEQETFLGVYTRQVQTQEAKTE